MTSNFLPATGSGEPVYRGMQCGAVDRDGNRCMLPVGHDRVGDTRQHRTVFNDEERAWTVRKDADAGETTTGKSLYR